MGILDSLRADGEKAGAFQDSGSDLKMMKSMLDRMLYAGHDWILEAEFLKNGGGVRTPLSQDGVLHVDELLADDGSFCLRRQVLALLYHRDTEYKFPASVMRKHTWKDAIIHDWQLRFVRDGRMNAGEMLVRHHRYHDSQTMYHAVPLWYAPEAVIRIPECYGFYGDEKEIDQMLCVIYPCTSMQMNDKHIVKSQLRRLRIYMHLSKIRYGILIMDAGMTGEQVVHEMRIGKEQEAVKTFHDRVRQIDIARNRVISFEKMPVRPQGLAKEHQRCRECDLYHTCYATEYRKKRLWPEGKV